MNKNISVLLAKTLRMNKYPTRCFSLLKSPLYKFSSSQNKDLISHRFPYGQAGEFVFDLSKRTYAWSFQTIWQDHAQLSYSGLTGQNSFFIIQNGKQVKIDDIDLQLKQTQYIKMHSKIPEDYTIRGKINGSIHHIKNSVSSKTRSNSYQIEILGFKNVYQWLNMECEQMKITNKNGEVLIGGMTVKNANIDCETFNSKKVMFSGQVNFKVSSKMNVRSIVSYQDAMTTIEGSGDVQIESVSGKIMTKNCKSLKIDRILSIKDGIQIQCQKINGHIVIQTGSGTIQCLRQKRQVLQQKIKLGKMHKGKLNFNIYDDPNSPYSKVSIEQ